MFNIKGSFFKVIVVYFLKTNRECSYTNPKLESTDINDI
jgi:hypothetical protein